MSTLELIVLTGVALWLAGLTFIVLVLVRQVGIVSIKLTPQLNVAHATEHARTELIIGEPLHADVLRILPELREGLRYLTYLSPTCSSCRRFVSELSDAEALPSGLILLMTGPKRTALAMVEGMVPAGIRVVHAPEAEEVAERIGIDSTPFLVQTFDGVLMGWSGVNGVEDLYNLYEAWKLAPENPDHNGRVDMGPGQPPPSGVRRDGVMQ